MADDINKEEVTEESSNEPTNKKWYVVQSMVGYEKKVVEGLKQAIETAKCEDFFGEILVPAEEVVEMRGSNKVRSERKFFPGYILVEMELSDEAWYLVRKVPKVLGFVGGAKPAPISKKEVDNILDRMKDGTDKPKPKVMYEVGEVVRVKEGPFADFSGVIEKIDYEKSKLVVAVLIFGRSTPVELGYSEVEKN